MRKLGRINASVYSKVCFPGNANQGLTQSHLLTALSNNDGPTAAPSATVVQLTLTRTAADDDAENRVTVELLTAACLLASKQHTPISIVLVATFLCFKI